VPFNVPYEFLRKLKADLDVSDKTVLRKNLPIRFNLAKSV